MVILDYCTKMKNSLRKKINGYFMVFELSGISGRLFTKPFGYL